MLAIVTAAKRRSLSLNDIAEPCFTSKLSPCQGGVREAGGGSGGDDVAAIAAGYHSISVKYLAVLRQHGVDLDDLFSSITPTTEAA